ncbi:MAG: hypothetical protein EXQ83_09965 [Xanthobacteraceae bacterium]|nr:hypothetical protein [Xanthobacteraceae bacterium]
MTKALLTAAAAATLVMLATPASAQYRFDRSVDPSQCRWWQTCDYEGRPYRGHRVWRAADRPRCPVEAIERRLSDGRVVTDRRRNCAALKG